MNEPTINNINLHEISQEIAKRKESNIEAQDFSDREALKRMIKEKHEELGNSEEARENVSELKNKKEEIRDENVAGRHMPDYAGEIDEGSRKRVENLIGITLEKGLSQGLKQAKKEEPYIIDLYHDSLVDKLLGELKEKNLL